MALVLGTYSVRPLPGAMLGAGCSICEKQQSKWEVVAEQQPVCAFCLLYQTEWGINNARNIEALISATELQMNTLFKKRDDNKLLVIDDADRIIYGVIMGTMAARRMARSNGKQH